MSEKDRNIDEYLKHAQEEDDALMDECAAIAEGANRLPKLSEEDLRLKNLVAQVENERKAEDKYIGTLTEEERKKYTEKKYKIVKELNDLDRQKRG